MKEIDIIMRFAALHDILEECMEHPLEVQRREAYIRMLKLLNRFENEVIKALDTSTGGG